jgi:hypothetical protein
MRSTTQRQPAAPLGFEIDTWITPVCERCERPTYMRGGRNGPTLCARCARNERPPAAAFDVASARAWREAARAGICVMCGSRQGLHGHHVIRQQLLRGLARRRELDYEELRWDRRNLLVVCERDHADHHGALKRIPRSKLPAAAIEFARKHGLEAVIEREYSLDDGEPISRRHG